MYRSPVIQQEQGVTNAFSIIALNFFKKFYPFLSKFLDTFPHDSLHFEAYITQKISHCLFTASTFWNRRRNPAFDCLIVTLEINIITAMSICGNFILYDHYRAEISRVDTSFLHLLTYLSDPGLWKLGSSLEMLAHYCPFISPRVWRDSEGKEKAFLLKVVPYLMTLESFHQLSGLTDQDKALWLMSHIFRYIYTAT